MYILSWCLDFCSRVLEVLLHETRQQRCTCVRFAHVCPGGARVSVLLTCVLEVHVCPFYVYLDSLVYVLRCICASGVCVCVCVCVHVSRCVYVIMVFGCIYLSGVWESIDAYMSAVCVF
jgi:hypothetical protein